MGVVIGAEADHDHVSRSFHAPQNRDALEARCGSAASIAAHASPCSSRGRKGLVPTASESPITSTRGRTLKATRRHCGSLGAGSAITATAANSAAAGLRQLEARRRGFTPDAFPARAPLNPDALGLAGACGLRRGDSAGPPRPPPRATRPAEPAKKKKRGAKLTLRESEFGKAVMNANGRVLYLFDQGVNPRGPVLRRLRGGLAAVPDEGQAGRRRGP